VTPQEALAQAFRDDRAAVLATVIRYAGDFEIAEEAVQDAFLAAVTSWTRDGVPANPRAWLLTAARRRAVDWVRRARSAARRTARLASDPTIGPSADEPEWAEREMPEDAGLADDRLRLIFTCCHPALDVPARVALTLRTLGGLTTTEIARAFLVTEQAMGKRIVRAKRKITDAHIPYRVPSAAELPARLLGVLQVVYLIFNEGYSANAGDALVRADLCVEALRLGRLLAELLPAEAEVLGLLALMELHDARRAARVDAAGRYVPLPDQDRSLWDEDRIQAGRVALERAVRLAGPGKYQLHAAITELHIRGAETGATAWAQIAELYDMLAAVAPSPVVDVNRAAAFGFAYGPSAGLRLLEPLLDDPALHRYQPLYATHADLLRRMGDTVGAARAYRQAIDLSLNAVERDELERRLHQLTD
jgi:RNA polymerase sigma-70 factor, ECF subfamily